MVWPAVLPRYAPQPEDVPWPVGSWPRGELDERVARVADRAFEDPRLSVSNAVLIVQAGRLVYERYGDVVEFFDRPSEPVGPETALLSWSMAKSMLHLCVGTLVDAGRLDPHAPASVPAWADDDDPRRAIHLEHLLAMRDGLDFNEAYVIGEPSHVIDMLFGEGKDDVAAYAAARPARHSPGAHFNYSSGTSNIVSGIVAGLVGPHDAYRAYLAEHVFGPLGMTSATPGLDGAGTWVPSSYVHATAQDFARFGLCYLRAGRFAQRQVVSREWCDTAQVPLSREQDTGHYYAWQWWVTGDEYGTYWASGYEGQSISVVPGLDALIVRLGHTPEERYGELYAWRRELLGALAL